MIKRIPWKILLAIICILLLCLMARCNSDLTYTPADPGTASEERSAAGPDEVLTDLFDSFSLMDETQFIETLNLTRLLDPEAGRSEAFIQKLSRKALELFEYKIEVIHADDLSVENPSASLSVVVTCFDYEHLNTELENVTMELAENSDLYTMTEAEILDAIADSFLETIDACSEPGEHHLEIIMYYDGSAWQLENEAVLEECLFGTRL